MKLRKLVLSAILSAMAIVLNEFVSIRIPPSNTLFTFSLGIIPIFFIAYYCGVVYSTISAVIIDILGWVIGGTANPFNIGFTLNALLSGLIIGLALLFKKQLSSKLGKILIAVIESLVTVITIPLFIYFFNKFGLAAKYNLSYASLIISTLAIAFNLLFVIYSIVLPDNEDNNAVNIGFQVYQITVSLFLTPLWVHSLYGTNYISLWSMRLISVPVLTFTYSLIVLLILRSLTKIYKAGHFNEKKR